MTLEAELAEAKREVLLLRQDLRDLFDALGFYEGARASDPHEKAGAGAQMASSIRRQNVQLKESLQARVESSLASS